MDLKAQIRAALEAAQAIAKTAADAGRGLTEDETTQIAAFRAKADTLKKALAAQELVASLDTEAGLYHGAPSHQGGAAPHAHPDDPPAPAAQHRVEVVAEKAEKGDALGALIVARYKFGQDRDAAIRDFTGKYGARSPRVLALQQSQFTAGGALLSDNFVGQELIELLRAKAAVRRAGARILTLVNGTATIPKVTGGSSSYWSGEGDNITPSDMATGQVKLLEKKLTSLVPVSNDLLKKGDISVQRMVRDDMIASSANTEDIAFLRGDGSLGGPRGVYHLVGDAGRTDTAGATLANIRTDVKRARNRLGNANAPNIRRAWFLHSRDINFIGTEIVDANSNLVWPAMAEGDGAKWNGGTVYENNNIPTTLGGGTESEMYLIEMSEFFIGDSPEFELELFANATYVDSSNATRSGVSRDESVVRLIRKTDCAMRHAESAHVTEKITYGV